MLQTSPSFAQVVAFYGDPLPHETRGRGYMQAVCAARMMALRTVMGEQPAIVWQRPAKSPRVRSAVPRAVTRATRKLTAEQFFDAYQIARRNVSRVCTEHWVIRGHARWATLPNGWRSFTGPRGGKVRLPRDVRVPAAEFWPGGVLPDGLVIAEPTPSTLTPWVTGADGIERHPMLIRLAAARAEQFEIDRPWRERRDMRSRIAKARLVRRGCLQAIEYGPSRPYFGMTVEQAREKLVTVRTELMADLRRYRETGSFDQPVEELDAMEDAG